jgi:hypothetical protein
MAVCDMAKVGQISNCTCFLANGASIGPGPNNGAMTTNQTNLCTTMETTLYSTFPQNATLSVPNAPQGNSVPCPIDTPYA